MTRDASDRLQDLPDAVTYLNSVKLHLTADKAALGLFLTEVGKWVEGQKLPSMGIRTKEPTSSILRIASILRFNPKLLHGLNALLLPDHRLECSTTGDEVKFFVLVSPTGARIFSTSCLEVPSPSSDHDLRNVVISKPAWKALLEVNPDKDWLTCISQLLEVIMDDPFTDLLCARRAYRCLRELAMRSILPPSIFISNLKRADVHPVQGGGFTDIYKGEMRGSLVCLRVLRMFETNKRELLFKDFCSEVVVWRQLRHPNILPFLGPSLDLFPSRFCFVSHWLHNGDIMSYLKRHPQHDRFTSICEIVEGIQYLHGLDPPVTHKDIKGTNVLVRDDLVCCLADFGLSSIVESQGLGVSPAVQGSLCWMAPELINPSLSLENNPKAGDIYALACTIFEIYTGNAPFLDKKKRAPAVMLAVLQGERPPLPPPGAWTSEEEHLWLLVDLCWKEKPGDRPEIYWIKRTLWDIGTFKPRLTQTTPWPYPAPKDSIPHLVDIQRWLRKEHQQKVQFSLDAGAGDMTSYVGPQEASPDLFNDTPQIDKKTIPRMSGRAVRQLHYPDSSQPNCRQKSLRLSFSSQDIRSEARNSSFPSHLLPRSRSPFLPSNLRQSNIKHDSGPLVNKLSLNPRRISSFGPAPSLLSPSPRPFLLPRNPYRSSLPVEPVYGDPLVEEDHEFSLLSRPLKRKPSTGLAYASSSQRQEGGQS